MSKRTCPVCHRKFEPGEAAVLPFCSRRCQQIDLGRWLSESYAVPVERDDEEETAERDAGEAAGGNGHE